jgi:hypothetical protein
LQIRQHIQVRVFVQCQKAKRNGRALFATAGADDSTTDHNAAFVSQSASHLHVKGDRVGQETIHGGILGILGMGFESDIAAKEFFIVNSVEGVGMRQGKERKEARKIGHR